MPVSADQLALLESVNAAGNAIPYDECKSADAANIWTDSPVAGEGFECRDYSLWKSDRLREQGFPYLDMSIVECWIESEPNQGIVQGQPNSFHAVLACKVDGVTWILDNRVLPSRIYDWRTPPYAYAWS